MIRRVLLAAGLSFGMLALHQIASAQVPEIEIQKGIEYGRHDGVPLLGDLYLPKAQGKYPTIVAVHGGGWQVGDRSGYEHWGPFLARRGYGLFSVSYRFSKPGVKSYPDAVHDVRAAVQFLRSKGESLKIDPSRLGLMGDSAGAHLAALVALAGDHPTFAGAYKDDPYSAVSTKVKIVVGVYGVYDLVQQWNHDQVSRPRDQIVEKFLGVAPMDNRRTYFDASPMSYATTDNRSTAFLIAYGTEDDVVDRTLQSEAFILALKQARISVRPVILTGAPHQWLWDPFDEVGSWNAFLAPRVLRFLGDRL